MLSPNLRSSKLRNQKYWLKLQTQKRSHNHLLKLNPNLLFQILKRLKLKKTLLIKSNCKKKLNLDRICRSLRNWLKRQRKKSKKLRNLWSKIFLKITLLSNKVNLSLTRQLMRRCRKHLQRWRRWMRGRTKKQWALPRTSLQKILKLHQRWKMRPSLS